MILRIALRWVCAGLMCLPLAAAAQNGGPYIGLQGHTVRFSVLAYDDPDAPIFVGQGVTVVVGAGVEFGLGREGAQEGVDVAPVTVDIGARRIEVRYHPPAGWLLAAKFNGYILEFVSDCALFDRVTIDRATSNLPLAEDAITVKGDTLYINVQGLRYTADSQFALNLDVADCPLS